MLDRRRRDAGARDAVTPAQIHAELERLRAAGALLRERPARETLDSLARVLDGWSDPRSSWQKKLEEDKFPWPRDMGTEMVELSGRELNWILDGMDVFALKPHDELSYETVL